MKLEHEQLTLCNVKWYGWSGRSSDTKTYDAEFYQSIGTSPRWINSSVILTAVHSMRMQSNHNWSVFMNMEDVNTWRMWSIKYGTLDVQLSSKRSNSLWMIRESKYHFEFQVKWIAHVHDRLRTCTIRRSTCERIRKSIIDDMDISYQKQIQ